MKSQFDTIRTFLRKIRIMTNFSKRGETIVLKVAICNEDVQLLCHATEMLGREFSAEQAEIEGFCSSRALLRAVSDRAYAPDVAIISLGLRRAAALPVEVTAIRELNRRAPFCRVFFLAGKITGREMRIQQYFSRKREREQQFSVDLRQALKTRGNCPASACVTAKNGGETFVIALADILCVERYGRKSRIVTGSGEYLANQHPEDLLRGLEREFVRCHQGYWVNLARISSQTNSEFRLDDGSCIPMSRTYRQQARDRFREYIKR